LIVFLDAFKAIRQPEARYPPHKPKTSQWNGRLKDNRGKTAGAGLAVRLTRLEDSA
jgi:hypothetical protein